MKKYIALMRPHHYIKNLLVFAALLCSRQLFEYDKLIACVLSFLAFCAVSSVVYIVNDICDRETDRNHPTKCMRPIASGAVGVKQAWMLVAVLIIAACLFNFLAFRVQSSVLLLLYFLINLGYSFGLKTIPILDVSILVAGFLIRILYGAIVTDIEISNWLYLTVIALSFFFALGKRRNEIKQIGGEQTRKVLRAYPIAFLDKSMSMCLTLANVFYALWSTDEKTMALYDTKHMIFTVPIVLLITMKYSLTIEGNSDGDPIEVLLHDKVLLVLCAVYLATMFIILYF